MSQDWPPYQPPEGYPMPPAAQPPSPRRRRGIVLGIGLAGAGAVAGAIIGSSVLSNAATPSTTTNAAYTAPSAAATGSAAPGRAAPGGNANQDSSKPVRSDEKVLSAALTAKLKAAALKAVPGGTVIRVESDSGDATYEAHMKKADGTRVTVKFDKNGTVTGVETGMGK